jgi:hypothetical protein
MYPDKARDQWDNPFHKKLNTIEKEKQELAKKRLQEIVEKMTQNASFKDFAEEAQRENVNDLAEQFKDKYANDQKNEKEVEEGS